ncbi:MAG: hypothetical protein ACW964_17760 [Candidatus Hodarchaeales archaeon]
MTDIDIQRNSKLSGEIKFIFSFIFAILLLLLNQVISFLGFLNSLLLLPITFLHEFGHYISAIVFLPFCNPQIELDLNEFGLSYAQLSTNGLPICFNSVLVMLAGSSTIILCTVIFLILSRNNHSNSITIFRLYLIFGLLSDIPNLFPILPASFGTASDGYSAWIYLYVLINLPFPTLAFSIIWTSIASIVIFTAYYYLGCTFYHSLTILNSSLLIKHKEVADSIS